MKQLYTDRGIPLPETINNKALTYPKLAGPEENENLFFEFTWRDSDEGHDFWYGINIADNFKEIWEIWDQKYPGTREAPPPPEPRKQPTLDDIFTL